jgi:hypothetical protein
MAEREPRKWKQIEMKAKGYILEEIADNSDFRKAIAELVTKYQRQKETQAEHPSEPSHEQRVREKAARDGYRLMHRRGNQYWLMLARPMTIEEIDYWIELDLVEQSRWIVPQDPS